MAGHGECGEEDYTAHERPGSALQFPMICLELFLISSQGSWGSSSINHSCSFVFHWQVYCSYKWFQSLSGSAFHWLNGSHIRRGTGVYSGRQEQEMFSKLLIGDV